MTGVPRSGRGDSRGSGAALGVMLIAVVLQVGGAILLKLLAENRSSLTTGFIIAGIVGVLVLNLLRLGVWGLAHSWFPLSTSFPLSSLFFPAMLLVAFAFRDEIGVMQVIGAALITGGTVWLTVRTQE